MIFIKYACGAPIALYSISPFGDHMLYIGTAPYGGHAPFQVTSKHRARTGENQQGEEQEWGVMASSHMQVVLLQVNNKKEQSDQGI